MTTISCTGISDEPLKHPPIETDSLKNSTTISADTLTRKRDTIFINKDSSFSTPISTGNVPVDSILNFAKTLLGTPYKYGSRDPSEGFDCSGFIIYVYNHFNIKVPGSSVDFTTFGKEVPVQNSRKGDIILFRGTDSTERFVGHMGIIISNDNGYIQFIHSTSGKAYGVVITPLNDYYKGRFVKVVRIGDAGTV